MVIVQLNEEYARIDTPKEMRYKFNSRPTIAKINLDLNLRYWNIIDEE